MAVTGYRQIAQGIRRPLGMLWLLLLWGVITVAHAADVAIEVQGADKDLKANILAYMGTVSEEEMKSWRGLQQRLDERVTQALQSQGYYSANYTIEARKGNIHLVVLPGLPVRVKQVMLDIQGEGKEEADFMSLQNALPIQPGDVFNHGKYEKLKSSVQELATELGYFDANWLKHEARVNLERKSADLDLVYDTGARYYFSKIRFLDREGNPQTLLQPRLLEAMLPFSEGEPYEADKVIELNRSLLNTRYFNEVRVQVQREQAIDQHVPVDVILSAAKPNHVDFGLGYSTDVRERVSAKWQRPLVNDKGHGIEASTELSPVRSTFDAKYTIPWNHPLNDTLQYVYGVKREKTEEVVNWNTVLGAQRQIKRPSGWQFTTSLRWNRDTTEMPTKTEKADLLLPGFSVERTRSKGGMDPWWGDRQFYQVEAGSEQLLSDVDLLSFRTGFRFLRTLGSVHQMLLRGDAGVLLTNNFAAVPQSMRFFAGGDQSVRGYSYRSISPRDSNGVLVGARNMLTGSMEYDYEFYSRWRLALFTDAGDAFDDIGSESFKIGSGAGIRWVSPVGPIRLDIAWAVSEKDKPFRIHFSMGPML